MFLLILLKILDFHFNNLTTTNLHYEKFPDGTIERLIFDFDIPDTWELTRLRNIGNIISGGTPKTTEKDYYNGNIPWITPSDMGKQQNKIYFESASKFISEKGLNNSSAQMIPANSIVYSSRAPIGHINIVNTEFTTNQGCKSIFPLLIDNEFLYWLLKNRTTDIQLRSSGTTFKEISGRSFGDTIICIPPYKEQKRITRKISSILRNINNYEKYYVELEKLKQEFPEKLRKSILQYAMQGKLVPQDATDEPVEVLLEKIREEKQKLFTEGKLKKKDLQESVIYQGDDNSYYEKQEKQLVEIPKSWKWVKLKTIAFITMGQSPKSKDVFSQKIVDSIEFHQGKSFFGKFNLNESKTYTTNSNKLINKPSVLLSVRAPVGDVNYVNRPVVIGRGLAAITCYKGISLSYLFNYLSTQKINLESMATGSTFKAINSHIINNILVPLPPTMEQKRIVNKTEKILVLISKL